MTNIHGYKNKIIEIKKELRKEEDNPFSKKFRHLQRKKNMYKKLINKLRSERDKEKK